jgi:hypothetical protein
LLFLFSMNATHPSHSNLLESETKRSADEVQATMLYFT